ncbi:hypothetical protein SLEP1_g702 [Rubroshorea leprosula]|uniref:TF-B3 domain-containing protein n=1 Tax=Rubroshorea leprosula TaxID=152421 RepID=A0AAV5HBH6_9ROSI|nr:hypothetical protein SLEP1_g702 [Rubroshorea leprosula]
MKGLEQLHVEDGENPTGFDAVDRLEEVMGKEDREIWLERQQNHLLDINDDASFFYSQFPPLPDFPCMSSTSSSSSTPAPVKEIACSSSASTASSSSSAASWAVLRSDADEDVEKRKINDHHDEQQYTADASTVALSSTASMEMPQQPLDDGFDVVDCMDVMENFGYMDLLDNNDFFDPSSILHPDQSPVEEIQQKEKQPRQVLDQEEQMIILQGNNNNNENGQDGATEDLAMVFLEWLKTNKETVSAEDLRRVKIKKATIECAARRLGGGKEAMKQLLKLILEWVQTNHLQKRRIKYSPSLNNNNVPYQYQPDPFQNPNPTPNPYETPPETNPCFSHSPWIAQPATYVPDPAAVGPGFAPVVGYMDPFSSAGSNINAALQPPYQPQTEYHMLDSSQTWPPSPFALASQYNTIPDNNLQSPPPPQPVFTGYANRYPYPYIPGHNDPGLARLGSSATREARKKRMARQRRFSTHHRNHSHHHNHQSQNQNQSADQHARLGSDNCTAAAQVNTAGNWVYWPPVAGAVGSAPPGDAPVGHPVDRTAMQGQNYHRQSASDKRQGWKSEKNLRFLLQKVLKQSDVGNLGRIVLPKKEAETHLPELEAKDGIPLAMEDIGTSRVWNMRYSFRFWPNNKSKMYLLENTGDFIRTNGLQEGDFIVIYSDVRCGKYLIRGVKVRQPETGGGAKSESKRPEKMQKNQHASSPSSVVVNGSSS